LVIEWLSPEMRPEIQHAVEELQNIIQRSCGGDISYSILDSLHPETDI
jgi:hypothetical protein